MTVERWRMTMPYHVGKSSDCPSSKPHAVIKDSDGKVMGCHSSVDDANKQIAAIHASEGSAVGNVDLAAAPPAVTGDGYEFVPPSVGTAWEGILLVEGLETGDGRLFSESAVTWINPTDAVVSLRRNIEDSHGGQPTTKTVLVGRINEIWRDPT